MEYYTHFTEQCQDVLEQYLGIYGTKEAESLRTEQNQVILLQRAARKHFLQSS